MKKKIFIVALFALFVNEASPVPVVKTGNRNEGMVYVPAGEFYMGCDGKSDKDKDCYDNETPYHKVYLDAFYIDKYEVTVNQFKACVTAKRCMFAGTGVYCNFKEPDKKGNHPINCVDWIQAKAYCEWVGKKLPTEAQWEKAARGADGRKYPWGNQAPTCDYAVFDRNGMGCGKVSTWEVGSKPKGASPCGAMDMAGNVWEWAADWYDENYYKKSPTRNPKGPPAGQFHPIRGGSWDFRNPRDLRVSSRDRTEPDFRHFSVGFRCAK